jgi:hypothetical protein
VFDDKKIVVNVLPQKSPAEPSEFRFNSMSVNLLFIVAFKSEKGMVIKHMTVDKNKHLIVDKHMFS